MNRRTILMMTLATAIWLGCVLTGDYAVAQKRSLKARLLGTWTFVSSNAKLSDKPFMGRQSEGPLRLGRVIGKVKETERFPIRWREGMAN